METKKCVRCGKEKPIDTFPRMKKWIGSYCLDCRREYSRKYYHAAKNKEPTLPKEKIGRAEYQSKYYQTHKKEIQERKKNLYYQRKEEKERIING